MATLVLSSNTVAEDAQQGGLVGILSVAGDIAVGETFTFTLNDERFAIINGNQLVVKSGGFDFEGPQKQFSLNIQAVGTHNTPVEAVPVLINVTNVNEAPTDILVEGGTIGDNAIIGATVATLAGQDPDRGDLLTYTIVTDMSGAAEYDHPYFGIPTGSNEIVVKHDLSDASLEPMTVHVKVTDAKGLSYVKQVTLTVTPVNEAPDVFADPVEVIDGSKGGTLVAVITAMDPEDGVLTYKLSATSAQWFNLIDNGDGTWNVVVKQGITLRSDRAAFQSFVIEVSDDAGNTTPETVFLNIKENLEPEATFEFLEVEKNTPAGTLVGTLVGYDPEGQAVDYTLLGESAALFTLMKNANGTYGVFVKQGVTLDYTDDAHHSFTVKVGDGFNSFEESFDLIFGNSLPKISTTTVRVKEGVGGGTVVGTVAATDFDGDALEYSLSEASSELFRLVRNTKGGYDIVVRAGVTLDYENEDHHFVELEVFDGIDAVPHTLTLNLIDVNPDPTMTFAAIAASEGAGDKIVGRIKASDAEDEEVVCTLAAESTAIFELIDNGDGDYDIMVREGVALDYENLSHRAVKVVVSDGVNTFSRTFALNIADETDVITGTAKADSLDGTAGRDIIKGLAGNDTLVGNAGDDTLYGGAGKDVLTGGGGQDVFVFDTKPKKKTNLDKITDFSVADDSIWLENKIFTKLGKKGSGAAPAQLKKSMFAFEKAKDTDDYIIYSKKTGKLYFDIDGSGSKAAVEIATLSKKLSMTNKDFFVI